MTHLYVCVTENFDYSNENARNRDFLLGLLFKNRNNKNLIFDALDKIIQTTHLLLDFEFAS